MAAANSALLERQKAEGEGCCDIENTEDTAQDQVIEMVCLIVIWILVYSKLLLKSAC